MIEKRKNVTKIEDLRPTQEERFERQMDMVFEAHPYYIELFKKMGLTRGDIKFLDDLTKLPLTYKEDWIAQPDDFRLDMSQISWATCPRPAFPARSCRRPAYWSPNIL